MKKKKKGCNEVVTWLVTSQIATVSQEQLQAFYAASLDINGIVRMDRTWRPLQVLNIIVHIYITDIYLPTHTLTHTHTHPLSLQTILRVVIPSCFTSAFAFR